MGFGACIHWKPRDGQCRLGALHGEVEVDDTWIGGPQPGIKGSRQLKDRRAVPVRSGRIRMVVLPNFAAMTMVAIFKEHIAPGSTVYTDGLALLSLHAAPEDPRVEQLHRRGGLYPSRDRHGRRPATQDARGSVLGGAQIGRGVVAASPPEKGVSARRLVAVPRRSFPFGIPAYLTIIGCRHRPYPRCVRGRG